MKFALKIMFFATQIHTVKLLDTFYTFVTRNECKNTRAHGNNSKRDLQKKSKSYYRKTCIINGSAFHLK